MKKLKEDVRPVVDGVRLFNIVFQPHQLGGWEVRINIEPGKLSNAGITTSSFAASDLATAIGKVQALLGAVEAKNFENEWTKFRDETGGPASGLSADAGYTERDWSSLAGLAVSDPGAAFSKINAKRAETGKGYLPLEVLAEKKRCQWMLMYDPKVRGYRAECQLCGAQVATERNETQSDVLDVERKKEQACPLHGD